MLRLAAARQAVHVVRHGKMKENAGHGRHRERCDECADLVAGSGELELRPLPQRS